MIVRHVATFKENFDLQTINFILHCQQVIGNCISHRIMRFLKLTLT